MKRYEKMGFDTEAALKWIYECKYRPCLDCEAYPTMTSGEVSSRCAAAYLLSDVSELPKVPRWMTAKTQYDFDKLQAGFEKKCRSTECRYCDAPGSKKALSQCYHAYLSELVALESEVDNG